MALFISPPFGNYVHLPNTIPIRGSFTLEPRGGLIKQIFKTLRYSFEHKGWINKIGLRNKGIDYAIRTYKKGQVISVAILKEEEIDEFIKKIPNDMNIELNISCPNLDKHLVSNNLDKFLNDEREWCIVKLSVNDDIDDLYKAGFRQFHCCNTIPIKDMNSIGANGNTIPIKEVQSKYLFKQIFFQPKSRGGLSGPALIPFVSKKIKDIKEKYPDTTIIAGGGIQNMDTLNLYKECGADYFSVSTLLFNPFKFISFYTSYNNDQNKTCK